MKDLTGYATASATPTMEAFADYLIAKVYGGTLPEGIDEVAFRKGVALGGSTRGYFQASDEWKSDERNYLGNVEKNRVAKTEERAAKAKAARAKAEEREAKAIAALEDAVAAAKAKAASLAPVATEGDESDANPSSEAIAAELAAAIADGSESDESGSESDDDGSDESRATEAVRAATESATRRSRRAA